MKFSSDLELEALIGRACLIFARVEQEAGQVVSAARGNWGVAMSVEYLAVSSNSGLLLDWLKAVGRAYPEVTDDVRQLRSDLRALKVQRDELAHSAAVVDLFLQLKESGRSFMSDSDVDWRKLLNGRKMAHIDPPSRADVDYFSARASDVGDAATALALRLAALAGDGVRPVTTPRKPSQLPGS